MKDPILIWRDKKKGYRNNCKKLCRSGLDQVKHKSFEESANISQMIFKENTGRYMEAKDIITEHEH